jgi:ERCC4-type nuclease
MKVTNDMIVTDSREQKTLWATDKLGEPHTLGKTYNKKLDFGDYSLVGHELLFSIERKSLPDLLQTLTSGHSRFKAELLRASKAKYFCIIVDGTYTQMRNKDYPNAFRSKWTKGKTIVDICNTLEIKYGIRIKFTTGRVESKRIIKDLMASYLKLAEAGHYDE